MVLCGNRTPSPSRDQVLRAHSPWTALRQRKKGRQDSRAAAPLRESDDDDGNAENRAPAGEDTHMQDLEDEMLNLGVGKVARPLVPRQNQGSGRFDSPPPPARAFRQRLVPLRTNNGGRRQDHGPFSVPSVPPASHPFDASSLPFESAFLRTASETGLAPSLPFGSAGWMSSGHQPASNPYQLASFGSDGVLHGGPGAAPHLGPALPRSVAYLQQQQQQQQDLHQGNKVGRVTWHPQLQQGPFGLASSAEGPLSGSVSTGQQDPSVPTTTPYLHSLSAEGPLMDKACAELQQCTGGVGPLPVAGQANQAGLPGAVHFTKPGAGVRPACCSRLSSSTSVPFGEEPCATGAGNTGQQQAGLSPLASQAHAALPQASSNVTAEPSDAGASELSAAFDDAGRVMREAASKAQGRSRAAAAALHPQVDQVAPQPVPAGMHDDTGRVVREVHAAASTTTTHRRTSSSGSGGTFRISSSFRFPRHDTHEEDGLEDDDEEEDKEDGAPSSVGCTDNGLEGSCFCWPTASAGGVAGVVKGKRSPLQHQAPCLYSPGDAGGRDVAAAGAASPENHPGGFEGEGAAAHAAASTPTGQATASGGAEAMQQSTGCGEKTGGGSVRYYGRAGYYSGGSSADKRTPGPRQRAPTPAGLLLGRPMFEDDEDVDLEGSCSLGSGRKMSPAMASGGSVGMRSSDVSAIRDQGGPSSSMRALKRSGSLAARSRYVQSVVALGEGIGIGVGVATPDEGMHGCRAVRACEQQQGGCAGGGPGAAEAGDAFGSWGAVESGQGEAKSGIRSGAGVAPPSTICSSVQGCGSSSGGSAAPEASGGGDDELAHLMCDECDFVTPPHSPTAASRAGGKVGQGAGPCHSVLREGAYAAGEAALQLRKARCASTSAAERQAQHQTGCPTHADSVAAGVSMHPYPNSHTDLHAHSELSQHLPLHHHTHSTSRLPQHQQQVHSFYSPMTLGSTMAMSVAASPAWAGAPHHHAALCDSGVEPMCPQNDQDHDPNQLLATPPGWGVSRPATWDLCGDDAEAGDAAVCEGQLLHHTGSGGSSWGGDSDEEEGCPHMALDSLVCLEDFNGHMSRAAARGNGGRALQLWAELRTRNIAPDLRTLNMLMRCLSKTATDPDHAEQIMSEVCALGDLTPNATTHILLAEIRVRFEQLLGL